MIAKKNCRPYGSIWQQGFALIATLTILVLILIIAVGMLSLSTVAMRSAGNEKHAEIARANARMALKLALGELQKTAGPDTRVTASAEAVAGVNGSRYVTGVWRSWEGHDHDKSTGQPVAPDYGIKLGKGEHGANPSEQGRFLGWLVSGPEKDNDADNPPSVSVGDLTVPMVAEGTLGSGTDAEVHVQPETTESGSYAWWVQGENQKALMDVAPEEPVDDAGWSRRLASHGRPDTEVFGFTDDSELAKTVSRRSLGLAANSRHATDPDTDVATDHFHDITTISRGLLTNTANGGWRRDLSLLAERWHLGIDNPGIAPLPATGLPVFSTEPNEPDIESSLRLRDNPTDATIYPWVTRDEVAMSWNGLLDFVALYKKVQLNSTSAEPFFDLQLTNTSDWQTIQPVLARVHVAFGYDAQKLDDDKYRPRLMMKPSVTMWNPYNVAIETNLLSELRIYKDSFPFILYATVGDQPESQVDLGEMMGDNVSGSYARYLPATGDLADRTMKPGESRMFGKQNTGSTQTNWGWFHMDSGFNIDGSLVLPLAQGSSITNGEGSDKYSFRWAYPTDDPEQVVKTRFLYCKTRNLKGIENFNWRLNYTDYTMRTSRKTIEDKIPLPDIRNDSQTLSTAADDDSPFLAATIGLRTLRNESEMGPTLQKKSHTKGYFNNDFLVEEIFVGNQNGNISGNFEDSPYTWEVYAPNDWESPYMPQSDDEAAFGKDHASYIGSSFQAGMGLNRWIIAELPTQPLLSLGELQHFNVDFRNLSPPHVMNEIGNSHASPHIARDQITNPGIGETSHDHSYASNHVFFDDWFVSSLTPEYELYTQNETRPIETVYSEFLSLETPLRNRQYLPATPLGEEEARDAADAFKDSLETETDLRNMPWYTVASEIEVAGMFNINSTSVTAWKAILMHLKDAAVPFSSVGTTAADEWETVLTEASGNPVTRTTVVDDPDAVATNGLSAFNSMSEEQIEALAREIVVQIKERGPFLSLSEFVNRRLSSDEDLAMAGAIEAALQELAALGPDDSTNPFATIQAEFPEQAVLPADANEIYEFPEAAEGDAAYSTPGWPRQADILRPLAPIISARDDTFLIRAYGDARDSSGNIIARSWCEAVVHRKAEFVDSADDATDSIGLSEMNQAFGRRFEIVSFRWLSPDEI